MHWSAAIDAVAFDLDGTLLALNRLPTNSLTRRFWVAVEAPLGYVMGGLDRCGATDRLRAWIDIARRLKGIGSLDSLRPVVGAAETVAELASRYRLGVVTNRPQSETMAFLERTGLGQHISGVVTRQDFWPPKPHPAPIRRVAELLETEPTRIVVVGDMTVDVRAAKRAGARAVGVTSGFCTREELERCGADHVLPSVRELEGLLCGRRAEL